MNRFQRVAAAAAIGTAVLAPATAAVANARPDPGTGSQSTSLSVPKAQIEHEELLGLNNQSSVEQPAAQATSNSTNTPWDVVGLAAFAGVALGAGAVVGVRYIQRVPKHA